MADDDIVPAGDEVAPAPEHAAPTGDVVEADTADAALAETAPAEAPVELAPAATDDLGVTELGPADEAAAATTAVDADRAVAADPVPVARRTNRRRLALRFALSFLLGTALVVGLGAGALYAWTQQYGGRILPGVHAGALDLSGMTPEAARSAIAAAWTTLGNGRIVLTGPKGDTSIEYAAIDRRPDVNAMLDAAMAAGHRGEPLADLIGAPQAAINGVDVAAAVTWDQGKLDAALAATAASIDHPATSATIAVAADGSFVVTPSTPGTATDVAGLRTTLAAKLALLDAPAELRLDLPVVPIAPEVASEAAQGAKDAGDRMAEDLALVLGAERWTVTSAQIRTMITFAADGVGGITPVIDDTKLDPILKAIGKAVNRNPKDARLTLVGRTIILDQPSQDGRKMDIAATRAAVLDALSAREAGSTVSGIALVVSVTQPALTSAGATAAAPGMVEISRWTTRFEIYEGNGFGANIWIPSKLLTGYSVAPGGTFDFLNAIGPITESRGFRLGGAIINGHSSPQGALGGGICSCSTTLFNAALRAGFKMGQRQNHYYYIDRYPIGLDATVFISSGGWKQSMTWTNDTANPVLIRGINTRSGGYGFVTFVLYSKPTGRTVVIAPAVIKDKVAPVDTRVYVSSLPKGAMQRVEWAIPGMNVWRTITVYQNGKVLRRTTYYSHYARMTGVLQVGTGGGPAPTPKPPKPKPTPVPTPAPTPPPPGP